MKWRLTGAGHVEASTRDVGDGIDRAAVAPHFEMKVRARRTPRRTDRRNDRIARYAFARRDKIRRVVTVQRLDSIAVAHDHHVAEALLTSTIHDAPRR